METINKSVPDILEELNTKIIPNLRKHDHVAKAQSKYIKELKSSLPSGHVLVIGDFSENFSFVVQDAVQGYHWTNDQATVHPWVCYYKDEQNELQYISVLMISDCTTHDVYTVSTFQKYLVEVLKSKISDIKKMIYFSDGAASQYKNCKNILNTAYHKEDYGIDAEWHYFATSHGKGACDGIGGTFKRYATKASLQRTKDHILTAQDLFSWSQTWESNIISIFISLEEIKKTRVDLKSRFDGLQTVDGTRGFHCFIPISKDIIRAKKYSNSQTYIDKKFKFKRT